jgi:medium-chain acyl-[acyl-carrier-protein] hydrolase
MDKIKLFCLPYAGGSASVYYKLRRFLNSNIALYPVELAGRGKRIKTPLYDNIEEAVDDIYGIIKDEVDDGPYALLGHSLGSILAFETLYKLEESGKNTPVHVFFSGSRPPHKLDKSKILHILPDEQFKEEIIKMGGTDEKVFENKELSDYFMRLLKSDFKMIETYQYMNKDEKLKSDITVLTGKADDISYYEILGWKMLTSGSCEIYEFEGNHFFINSCTKEIVDIINRTLANSLAVLNVR